jgi:hypothetical protein
LSSSNEISDDLKIRFSIDVQKEINEKIVVASDKSRLAIVYRALDRIRIFCSVAADVPTVEGISNVRDFAMRNNSSFALES